MSEERKEEVVTVARVNASQPTFTWPTPPRADRDGSAGDRERWPQYSQLTPSCKVKAQNCLSLAMMWFRKKQQVREHVMCENTVLLGHCDNWKQCILWRIDCCDNFDRFKYCFNYCELVRLCDHQLSRHFSEPSEKHSTGLGKRVVPRLRESRLLTPSGREARVNAT